MAWLELTLTVPPEKEEEAAAQLAEFAPGGVASEPAGFAVLDEGVGRARPVGPVTLHAYFPGDIDQAGLHTQVTAALAPLHLPVPRYHLIDETDWSAAWKTHYQPVRIGHRLLIVPAWLNPPLAPTDVPIRLDPGMAFGTGTHPTTQLCLAALEKYLQPGAAVIDLGTGSGILAIAAAKLGAAPVLGVDVDAEAVRVARENCAANGVADQVRIEAGSLAEVQQGLYGPAQAPLVVANILTIVLLDMLAHGLAQSVTPGGWLVLSGVLAAQAPELTAALLRHGLTPTAQEQIDDWVVIAARPA